MKGSSRKATRGGPTPDGEAAVVAIVDDDASVRQSMLRLVRSFGYRAEAFGSGEEFLGSPLAPEAACLLLDVRMPSMDGLDVQRRLAEMAAAIPIVFLTGRATEDEERRAPPGGPAAFPPHPPGRGPPLHVPPTPTSPKRG